MPLERVRLKRAGRLDEPVAVHRKRVRAQADRSSNGDDNPRTMGAIAAARQMSAAAYDYLNRNWRIIPIPHGQKDASRPGWQKLTITRDNLRDYFPAASPRNVGVQLGRPSGGLTDADLDCREAIPLAPYFLPPTRSIFGRPGKERSHWLFYTKLWKTAKTITNKFAERVPNEHGHLVDGDVLAELRTGGLDKDGSNKGALTLLPPSWRDDIGGQLRWEEDGEPAEVDGGVLKHSVEQLATAALLLRHYPKDGHRHDCALAIGGLLARAKWSEDEIANLIKAVTQEVGDEEARSRIKDAASAVAKLAKGEPMPGLPRVRELWGDVVADTLARWLDIHSPAERGNTRTDTEDRKPETGKPTLTGVLLGLVGDVELFHSPDGVAHADIEVDGHRETWPINSRHFKKWLRHRFYKATGSAANPEIVKSVLATLEAQAQVEGPERCVHLRVASYAGCLYLDLCNECWEAVKITPEGWKVVVAPKARFIRHPGMLPLPVPAHSGDIDLLRCYLNLTKATDDDDDDGAGADDYFVLTVSFLMMAMRAEGPYPILAFTGEHGTAKSTSLKVLLRLVDPNDAELLDLPHDARDIHIAGSNCHLPAYDNLSWLPKWMADTLCRISTGAGHRTRQLYTDADEQIFRTKRPQMLGSIKNVVTSPDLADRTISMTLGQMPKRERRAEGEFWANFERDRPRIIGALLDGMVHGLRELPRIDRLVERKELQLPRMADFAIWANACEGAFWADGTFNDAYERNRSKIGRIVVDADAVAVALHDFMKREQSWSGTASQLLSELSHMVDEGRRKERDWPRSPNALSGCLRDVRPWLQEQGIDISYRRKARQRTIIITRAPITISDTPSSSSSSSANALKSRANDDDDHDRLSLTGHRHVDDRRDRRKFVNRECDEVVRQRARRSKPRYDDDD
ncbi:Bifunctional DNA primase/polymerase, N-terminal [Rhizobiales bacterium GAS113]|nr:Bifunctional DNA primase/polymerase, N-terminal [Rhizobiales bacterium GAS113]